MVFSTLKSQVQGIIENMIDFMIKMDIFFLDKSRQLFKLLRTLTQINFCQLIWWQIEEKMF